MNVKFLVAAALALATIAQADDITMGFAAGTASTNDQANYFGGGNRSVSSVAMSISWSTDPADYNCTNTATLSACYLLPSDPTGMSASFTGTSNSVASTFSVDADASPFQVANSPATSGSFMEVYKNGNRTSVQWYVVGQGFLEAGNFDSSVSYDNAADSVLDPAFMSLVNQNAGSLAWFVSAPWSAAQATYYPNGGDYFPQFGVEAVSPSAPEPATWFSLIGGLGFVTLMKRRARAVSR